MSISALKSFIASVEEKAKIAKDVKSLLALAACNPELEDMFVQQAEKLVEKHSFLVAERDRAVNQGWIEAEKKRRSLKHLPAYMQAWLNEGG
jgi:hypothetical protein